MSFVQDNFKMLSEICQCIAMEFGKNCEVVLHDLTRPYDNSIVGIWNSHITGRKIGGAGTNMGLEILRGTVTPADQYNYINRTEDGKILRSSSKYFIQDGKVVGSLCINFDITDLLSSQKTLENLTTQDARETTDPEVFKNDIEDLLQILLNKEVLKSGKKLADLKKEDKIIIVRNLDQRGVFLIKKATERVAEFLGITRFTVYNYLNSSQNDGEK